MTRNPVFPFAFAHRDRFQLSGGWGPPTLPSKLSKYMVPEGWCETEAEALEAQRLDEEHIGDRHFRVVVHDTLVSADGAPVPPDDPVRAATKTVLSPAVPPRDREDLASLVGETPEGTPAGNRAGRMAWAMAFKLCGRREESYPTPETT